MRFSFLDCSVTKSRNLLTPRNSSSVSKEQRNISSISPVDSITSRSCLVYVTLLLSGAKGKPLGQSTFVNFGPNPFWAKKVAVESRANIAQCDSESQWPRDDRPSMNVMNRHCRRSL